MLRSQQGTVHLLVTSLESTLLHHLANLIENKLTQKKESSALSVPMICENSYRLPLQLKNVFLVCSYTARKRAQKSSQIFHNFFYIFYCPCL